jgi:hypothetical protein
LFILGSVLNELSLIHIITPISIKSSLTLLASCLTIHISSSIKFVLYVSCAYIWNTHYLTFESYVPIGR